MLKKSKYHQDSGKVKRATSDISFFNKERIYTTPKEHKWVDETWQRMDVDQRIDAVLAFRDDRGRGVLTRAVRKGDYALVDLLLDNDKVNVNEQDMYGNTPLHHAVLVPDCEMLRLLLDCYRINTGIVNKNKHSVLQMLKALDEPGGTVFPSTVYDYCYSRILQL